MKTVFSSPGKLGDALLQWPIAYQWSQLNRKHFDLWLDEKTCAPLVSLFASQECVDEVTLKSGIDHHRMGGQPWHFGLDTQDHQDLEVIHLGMRSFPEEQITLQTLKWVPFSLDRHKLAKEPSLSVPHEPADRLLLHGTYASASGTPGFWRFLSQHWDELLKEFEDVGFIGSADEIARAREVYPEASGYPDGGDLAKTAQLMAGSRMVIGSGSSMVVLAGCLKIPCLRIHDPIGNYPKVLWSNLGKNQFNETERDLRRLWPEIKDECLSAKAVMA
jgi:ADP-heptose:LPS heptosyltransferase